MQEPTAEPSLTALREGYQTITLAREIFVVDDDETMQELLAATLAPEGFPVTTFADGEALLSAARSRVPLCIFLDLVMPRRSGLDILKEFRARHYWTPIYLISALDDLAIAVEGMRQRAQDYLRKPLDLPATALRVRHAVELWVGREHGRQHGRAVARAPAEPSGWFLLTPREREMLMLMRLMEIGGAA